MSKFNYEELMLSRKDEDGKGAVFNMAFGLLEHLNKLIVITSMASINDELVIWFKALANLYRCVASYIADKDIQRIDDMFHEVWKTSDNYENMQKMNAQISSSMENRFKLLLHNFDKELKAVMKKEDLLIPVKQGIKSALDG